MLGLGAASLILNINNSATVTIATKNFALEILPNGSTCPAYGAPAYNLSSNSTISLNWGTITEPGSANFLFCLENVGTATSSTFTQGTVSPPPSPGALTIAPAGSVTIAAQSVTPITVTLNVTTGVPATIPGITYSFSLTIG